MARQHHERYYFDDGNVIFLAENTLFSVHRYFLQRDSPIFQAMFSRPSSSGEGKSDDNPIVLEGTKSADLSCFLSCLYPINYGHGDLTTYEEWAAALELAVKWEFDRIRDFIVQRIKDTATLVEQIVTARRLNMQQWCWDVCAKLCERAQPLTLEEGQRLGLEDTVRISEVREKRRARPKVERSIVTGYYDGWQDPEKLHTISDASDDVKYYVKETLQLPELPFTSPEPDYYIL
ncbi:uncharacterized protein B0H18DRAFT_1002395 [Fomitopsis serialis]|uniref:uncharacterized protein n=1 Tax=Fomitopsis serialis TaxID=139415 RepID=UPI002008D22C|nr:uncharacterized protein B0H18DRAFT_1002395 [Neoantrodia serialis]KAH9927823.1 hypothetical protein B0H18DRAFT_1002395 [Neoantrodia serialis]